MSTHTNPLTGAYLSRGTIGDLETPGSPVMFFALVVVPGQHKVTGTVLIRQVEPHDNWGGQVTGTIFKRPGSGSGGDTAVITLHGMLANEGGTPLLMPGTAYMQVDATGNGIGGFDIVHDHLPDAPVRPVTQ